MCTGDVMIQSNLLCHIAERERRHTYSSGAWRGQVATAI